MRNIFAGMLKCRYCAGAVTRVSKGGAYSYLICSAAHAKAATCKHESVSYQQAVDAFMRHFKITMKEAPRGKDTAEIANKIAQMQAAIDAGEDRVNELLEITITDRSRAARQALQKAEQELDEVRGDLRRAIERRDTLTSTNVKTRLAAVQKALTGKPMDTEEANKALRGAVRQMIMRPQEGRLDILWHHAEEPQEVLFMTSRFDWGANQIEKNTAQ